jgi:hypothetical protein
VGNLILSSRSTAGVIGIGGKFTAGIVDIGGKLSPASLTQVKNLLPVVSGIGVNP